MSSSRAARLPAGQRRTAVLALISVVLVSLGSAMSPVGANAAEDLSVGATADATVLRSLRDSNFGSDKQLSARGRRAQSFVRFDTSAWNGKAIDKLTLRLTVNEGNLGSLRFRLADASWDEQKTTWRTRPPASRDPVASGQGSGGGTFDVDLRPLFPSGKVDRNLVSLKVKAVNSTGARIASRESGQGPRLLFVAAPEATQQTSNRTIDKPLRFYTPNIIRQGDSGPFPRDTTSEQLERLFSSESEMRDLLQNVDVYTFFGASVIRGEPAYDAMLRRAVPMLTKNKVAIGLEVGGPLGYAPGVTYGGDSGGANGRKSAQYDVDRAISKIESMGGRVQYVMMDGALRRTIRNGVHSKPHQAFLTVGVSANQNALTYRAKASGFQGNQIQIAYAVAGPRATLRVEVNANAITVWLATDAAGQSVSTAQEVAAAVTASAAASSLVTVANHASSNGSAIVLPKPATPLAWGDDGLNMTSEQSVAEVVSYMRTVRGARPGTKFVLLEAVVLWPYDGKAGYTSVPYPSAQRPDFKLVWRELDRQLRNAGMLGLLAGMHNDVSVEYLDGLVPSINRLADDWYERAFKLQQQVEGSGVPFGQMYNSLWGGDPGASSRASGRYFQEQVLHHVSEMEARRSASHPNMDRPDHFVLDAFMYYPRVISPSSERFSTDDTYLRSLDLYESLVEGATSAGVLANAA